METYNVYNCTNSNEDKSMLYSMVFVSINSVKSCLRNRKQIFCIGKNKSQVELVTCSIPQCSALGPVLLTLMISLKYFNEFFFRVYRIHSRWSTHPASLRILLIGELEEHKILYIEYTLTVFNV